MIEKKVKIGFIGAGSLGSVFGGYLASCHLEGCELEVVFFCRKEHADAINTAGLTIHRFRKNQDVKNVKNIKAFSSSKNSDLAFDYLFLTTKTYDIESALSEYRQLVNNSRWVVILQNGIGNEEIVGNYCDKNKIIRIVTSHGACSDEAGHVTHTGLGTTKIGFPFNSREELALLDLKDLLDSSGIETSIADDIVRECWEKVFVNIGINAFGALTRLKNGELLKNDGLKKLMMEAVIEAIKIAELKKINLSGRDQVAAMFEVARKTLENKNSMLQDVLKGKKTEVDVMNGKIVGYALEFGEKVPINELLTSLIKGLEQSFD